MGFSINDQIEEDMNTITPDELRRSRNDLTVRAEDETVLGTIHNERIYALLALSRRYAKLEDATNHIRAFEAESKEQKTRCRRNANRYHALHEYTEQMFWVQCREEIGIEAWDRGGVGIRQGFVLVYIERPKRKTMMRMHGSGGMPEGLREFLFGPGGVGETMGMSATIGPIPTGGPTGGPGDDDDPDGDEEDEQQQNSE